eukprot:TRINITY_DN552_c0_g1_i1.p1 TRINITY_DN552_c0_g1~~TRINITY_DN552_c0_g1_i1.p1  ORF type:complete len:66 (-),score=12.25 TRINITY_DN552_c0_g1_i1:189-386(-)
MCPISKEPKSFISDTIHLPHAVAMNSAQNEKMFLNTLFHGKFCKKFFCMHKIVDIVTYPGSQTPS